MSVTVALNYKLIHSLFLLLIGVFILNEVFKGPEHLLLVVGGPPLIVIFSWRQVAELLFILLPALLVLAYEPIHIVSHILVYLQLAIHCALLLLATLTALLPAFG